MSAAPNPSPPPILLWAAFFSGSKADTLLKVDLAVDGDRSGTQIDPGIRFDESDRTSEDDPYYFWLNNDIDHGNDDEAEDREPTGAPDHLDGQIDFTRDLEDFSRLWIDIGGIEDQLKSGTLRLGFEWKNVSDGDPAIKLYNAVETDGGMKYLFDENVANQQKSTVPPSPYAAIGLENELGDLSYDPINDRRFFPQSFWDDVPDGGIVHFLFEATSAGKGELVIALQTPTQGASQDVVSSMSGVWLNLKDIKEMYQHFTVGDSIDADPAASASEINGVSKTDLDDLNLDNDYILFVHGWRMHPWERRYFAETAFKRLYWLGYKGRFGMFSWPTEWTSRPWGTAITDTENYMRSDHKARLSAQGLAGTMNNLMGTYVGQMSVFAHSMGNIVVSEALRQGGQAKTFVACQSASVARAYDFDHPERLTWQRVFDAIDGKNGAGPTMATTVIHGHPDVFANYPPIGEVYYSGISSNLVGDFINHHNREDDALAWWLAGQARKPNDYYSYDEANADWNFEPPWPLPDRNLQFPQDTYLIFARAAEPDSVPLGASVANGFATGGEVNGNRNLQGVHGFQDDEEDHSAQFRSTIQRRWDYWEGLMNDFEITP